MPGDFRQPSRNISSSVDEILRSCNYVKFVLQRSRPFILGTLRRAQNVLRLVALGVSPTIVDNDSTNFLKTVSLCRVCFMHLWVFFFAIAPFGLSLSYFLLCEFLCQAGYFNGNPSGSRSENRPKRPSWRSGSSSAVTLLTDITLWISYCSTAQITVIAFLRHPKFRNNSILFLGNPRGHKIRLIFGNEWRYHCLHYDHGLNATSFIYDNSVPFLNVWNCHFQMMKSCPVTKKLSPQDRSLYFVGQDEPSRSLGTAYGGSS